MRPFYLPKVPINPEAGYYTDEYLAINRGSDD
jgi:hypothetical protein